MPNRNGRRIIELIEEKMSATVVKGLFSYTLAK
jgi:hypothetical protein